ncbi:MAG TPA: hypothetical protein VFL34_08880, partial [Candidatus Sulfotelmatobacter sp.]|nr:hypothetical protein [Candidatus Sulfotelmatobacter sp.]
MAKIFARPNATRKKTKLNNPTPTHGLHSRNISVGRIASTLRLFRHDFEIVVDTSLAPKNPHTSLPLGLSFPPH